MAPIQQETLWAFHNGDLHPKIVKPHLLAFR